MVESNFDAGLQVNAQNRLGTRERKTGKEKPQNQKLMAMQSCAVRGHVGLCTAYCLGDT